MQHHYWQYAKPGDLIDIVAPAYGCPPEMLLEVKAFIESLGFSAHIPEDLLGADAFCANSDEKRLEILYRALVNPDSHFMWCVRGGYGSARLISRLMKMPLPQKVKLLIGFSDITAMHIVFQQHFGWPTLHAKVLSQFCGKQWHEESAKEMQAILTGKQKELEFSSLIPLNAKAGKPDVIHSMLAGGNLSLLQTSIGTVWQLKSNDKIVVIEEVDERGYRVDRMFNHLRQTSVLDGAKAIIIGDFIGGEEKDGRMLGELAIRRFAEDIDIPVLRCVGIGHGSVNHPLPFGTAVTLTLGNAPSLVCHTGGC